MAAETLRCPGCGAPALADAPSCTHCGIVLATVGCPSCFGMMFTGARHCPHCGARGAREEGGEEALACPRCRTPLASAHVGAVLVRDCGGCGGVWLDAEAFQAVTTDRERQAAVLAFTPAGAPHGTPEAGIRYSPCPRCGSIMNRVNFARISGVVVDSCKPHGTWFDRDELRRIVEFIRGGGLEAARDRERVKLGDERRRIEQLERGSPVSHFPTGGAQPSAGDLAISALLGLVGLIE